MILHHIISYYMCICYSLIYIYIHTYIHIAARIPTFVAIWRARSRKIFVLDAALAHRRSPSHPPPGTRAEDAKAKAAKAAKAVKRGTKGKLLKKRFSPTFHRYAPIAHRAAPAPLPRRHRPAAHAEPANAPT